MYGTWGVALSVTLVLSSILSRMCAMSCVDECQLLENGRNYIRG
jgi:hypothetical protein